MKILDMTFNIIFTIEAALKIGASPASHDSHALTIMASRFTVVVPPHCESACAIAVRAARTVLHLVAGSRGP